MPTDSLLRRLARAHERLRTPETSTPVAELAAEAGLSTGYFIRLFAALYGHTPHQCRMEARLRRARLLIGAGTAPVTEVCLDLGFSSLGSFSTLFARRVGLPPSAYRRHVRCLVPAPERRAAFVAPACMSLMQAAFARMDAAQFSRSAGMAPR